MLRFHLFVTCENDAFVPDATPEVIRILRETADRLERNGASGFFETIRDSNGNDVGRFALKHMDGRA